MEEGLVPWGGIGWRMSEAAWTQRTLSTAEEEGEGERAEHTSWGFVVRVGKQDPVLQLQGSEPRFIK